MIIVDTATEDHFLARLEEIRLSGERARGIYLRLHEITAMPGRVAQIIALATHHLTDSPPHLYLFEDGDVAILAPVIAAKPARELMLALGALLNRPVEESWIAIYELPLQLHPLLSEAQAKHDRWQTQQDAARNREHQQRREQRRQSILQNTAQSAAQGAASSIQHRRMRRTKPRLMIIEDDAFSRKLVEKVLEPSYELVCHGTASGALELYAQIGPDVLFLDIQLPDVTGHELLERILAIDPEAYVVMFSGSADRENITRAMQLGAKGFVAKPFTREKLLQYVERCPTLTH